MRQLNCKPTGSCRAKKSIDGSLLFSKIVNVLVMVNMFKIKFVFQLSSGSVTKKSRAVKKFKSAALYYDAETVWMRSVHWPECQIDLEFVRGHS